MPAIDILDFLRAIRDPSRLPEQLDRSLVLNLLPELSENQNDPRTQVRLKTATEMVTEWRMQFMTFMDEGLKKFKDTAKEDRETTQKTKAELAAANIQIQELRRDLTAAQEGRGIYESKVKTELEAKLAHKDRLLAQATELQRTISEGLEYAQAQLRSTNAKLLQCENTIAQLNATILAQTEAAKSTKSDFNTIINSARTLLGNARDNIDDRYGDKASPFIAAIRDDIVAALLALPPQV